MHVVSIAQLLTACCIIREGKIFKVNFGRLSKLYCAVLRSAGQGATGMRSAVVSAAGLRSAVLWIVQKSGAFKGWTSRAQLHHR